jgi:phosphohistidine phosphatase
MKTLLLVRHAKSSWDDPSLKDYDRPLNARGQADAPRMGRLLLLRDLVPDAVLCSPSQRTRQTYDLLQYEWPHVAAVAFPKSLYHCPALELCDLIRTAAEPAQRLMVIGHNPGLADFLFATVHYDDKFPTAAIAWLTVDIDTWADFHPQLTVRLQDIWRPKDVS